MKKIMFDDRFGLTKAVLDGTKTMTRRTITQKDVVYALNQYRAEYFNASLDNLSDKECLEGYLITEKHSYYKVGDVVAIAQSGKCIYCQLQQRYGVTSDAALGFKEMYQGMAFWTNKMFTPADLCPNKIQINGLSIECIQDVSDEDCLKEGIIKNWGYRFDTPHGECVRSNPRDAFACLIDCVSGKGTWECNPWVVAYSYKNLQ